MNTSSTEKNLVNFVKENPHLIEVFTRIYSYINDERFTQENLIKSAQNNNIEFKAGEKKECIFGDEDGTLIGQVFDYILREGGKSKSFVWWFKEYLR